MRRRLTGSVAFVAGLALLWSALLTADTTGQTAQSGLQFDARAVKSPVLPTVDDDGTEVVRIHSNLVVVPVSVTDGKGRPTQGLGAGDFRLEEGGREQAVELVASPEQVPIHLALLLDISSSVKKRFKFEQKAAARFLRQVLRDVDTAAVFTIGDEPALLQARAGAEQAVAAVEVVQPSAGMTAFNDALVAAAEYLEDSSPSHHRRVIVALSDGVDTCSKRCTVPAEAIAELQRADTTFYAINPSGRELRSHETIKRGQDHMEKLATATGGTAFFPGEIEDLDKFFRKIIAELRSPYLLQYYSQAAAPGGTFISIKVRVPTQPKLRVHARSGYYVSDR